MAEAKYETHEYDVVVIGAGGAGLRAAVEASAQGVEPRRGVRGPEGALEIGSIQRGQAKPRGLGPVTRGIDSERERQSRTRLADAPDAAEDRQQGAGDGRQQARSE